MWHRIWRQKHSSLYEKVGDGFFFPFLLLSSSLCSFFFFVSCSSFRFYSQQQLFWTTFFDVHVLSLIFFLPFFLLFSSSSFVILLLSTSHSRSHSQHTATGQRTVQALQSTSLATQICHQVRLTATRKEERLVAQAFTNVQDCSSTKASRSAAPILIVGTNAISLKNVETRVVAEQQEKEVKKEEVERKERRWTRTMEQRRSKTMATRTHRRRTRQPVTWESQLPTRPLSRRQMSRRRLVSAGRQQHQFPLV